MKANREQPARDPIRRDSYDREAIGSFSRRFDPRERSTAIRALRRHERANRLKGRRRNYIASDVLEALLVKQDPTTGYCEPSIAEICGHIRASKDAVCRALNYLRRAGFLESIRRSERTGYAEGPQRRQIENAYRISIPARALALLAPWEKPAPTRGEDSEEAARDRAAEFEKMRGQWARSATWGDLKNDLAGAAAIAPGAPKWQAPMSSPPPAKPPGPSNELLARVRDRQGAASPPAPGAGLSPLEQVRERNRERARESAMRGVSGIFSNTSRGDPKN